MKPTPKSRVKTTIFMALLTLVVAVPAMAQITYLDDGAVPNTRGGWDLPAQGTCPAGTANGYTGIDTRPECVALRLNIVQASCTSGSNLSWTTSGVCNDLVHSTQATCEATEDRLWNPGTSTCAVVMSGDDRNNVVCALHGATWVTTGTCTGSWVMPARTAYQPTLLSGNGAGDQCLRCHNDTTQYNGPRVRDTEETMMMGHKNMARKVGVCSDRNYSSETACTTAGQTWSYQKKGGPPFSCTLGPTYHDEDACVADGGTWDPETYAATDTAQAFDWPNGNVDVSGTPRRVKWIYGDWLAALPRAIYEAPAATTKTCTNPLYTTQATCEGNGGTWVFNAGASYSCGRCHTTGWSSDAAINANKEPEKSFPGVTWDRNSDAGFGKVNMTGGVSGDANKYSSWDVWGISCTRCHNSVVDLNLVACTGGTLNSTNCTGFGGSWSSTSSTCSSITPAQCSSVGGTLANYVAPAGRSSHHNNLTAPDGSACTLTDYTTEATCTTAGGLWLTPCSVNPTPGVCTYGATTQANCTAIPGSTWTAVGYCSSAFYTTQADCAANGATWTEGFCSSADAIGTCSGGSGNTAKTWRLNGTQQSCQIAAATWSYSKCSVPGICNTLNPAHNTKATCEAASGQWALATDIVRCVDIHEYGKEHNVATYEAAKWTGNNATRGQVITRLCMDCHRQETSGVPYANSGTSAQPDLTLSNPGSYVKVGPYHGSIVPVSHPHGNQFLNSPHARFSGTFAQIGTAKNSSGYGSWFMTDGEAASTGNGCTGCHDVHASTVASESAIREECTECHSGAHAVSLTKIKHGGGAGTPLENMATKPAEACEICHMPEGLHLWRINTSAAYSTYPASALNGTVNANTYPENAGAWGTKSDAVWVDVDFACGQCHGGGTSYLATTGSTVSGSAVVTVPSTAGLAVGQRVRITGAGALYYDDLGVGRREDLDSYIKTIPSSTTFTLVNGTVPNTLASTAVVQNPTKNGALYRTKAALAVLAYGMHSGANTNPPAPAFTYALALPAKLHLDVDASTSYCGNGACTSFEWNWGDGTANTVTAVATASHDYAPSVNGRIVVTLTASKTGVGGSVSKTIAVGTSPAPAVGITCANLVVNPDTWVATITDSSALTNIKQVVVNWGDGTVLTNLKAPFASPLVATHTFLSPPSTALPSGYQVQYKVVDTSGRFGSLTCPVTTTDIHYFYVAGTVLNGVTPVASAAVTLKRGTVVVGQVFTNASGQFTFGTLATPTLKPGSYAITVTKTGLTFPSTPLTLGPSNGAVNILAN